MIAFGVAALAYVALGVATAVLCIMMDGEPPTELAWVLTLVVALWPIVAATQLPIYIARRINARGGAKPEPFEDQLL